MLTSQKQLAYRFNKLFTFMLVLIRGKLPTTKTWGELFWELISQEGER